MSTTAERHTRLHFRLKAEAAAMKEQHSYFGSHNVWYGEPLHACECGFESHEKAEVLEHVAEANKEEK